MSTIKLYNADSFRFCNAFICNYKPYKELLKICIENHYTGFVIFKKKVYFRNEKFKELISNYIYHKDSVFYILIPNIYKKFIIEAN